MDMSTLRSKVRARLPDAISALRQQAQEHAPDRPPREAGYTIRNAVADDGDTAVVRIYDEIWFLGVNADDFVRDLDTITAPKIRVEINSPGGDVFDAIAIYNALRTHPAHVTTRVDGIAASAASLIVQAGDRRTMLSAAQMMIHNAWGLVIGDSRAHGDMQQLLAQQDDIIASVYARRSGVDAEHFRELMAAETWLNDESTVDEGLADEVVDPPVRDDDAPTLNDEISRAVDAVTGATASAERVAALRADAGKRLSNVNRDSLAGLRDAMERLDGLLDDGSRTADGDDPDGLRREYARFVATIQGVKPS